MILTCPSCAARFIVDPVAIGAAGRTVRCGKCRHEWRAAAPLTQPTPGLQPAAQKIKPVPRGSSLPVPVKSDGRVPPLRSALFAVIAAVLLAMPLLAIKLTPWLHHAGADRQEKTQPIALDGMPVTRLRQEEGRPVVDIQGTLINHSGSRQKIPTLKARAMNARGGVVREWAIPLTQQQLEPGQRLPFTFSAPLPDQGVEDIAFHLL